ncbi:ac18-like protein [Alphabaculovirus altersperidaniae]|uniref:Ac18-like protein n=1 Tax=Spodoptera eridania nucleopolyhedrovirus TaxID=2315721 RepID=A0ABX6TQB7_9ABAC|nr:ac18-like protein [Spodoptera eridania nucleopolyhedrovirus]QNV47794.1 ac18-like protein [Spodoptera eridania nucleopolyhedrovirus]
MESLQQRLFKHKSIPYISKKYINDQLGDYVLRNTVSDFHRAVLPQAILSLNTLCVVKGGAAISVHMKNDQPRHLTDFDLEVYVDDNRATVDNLHSFVALQCLEEKLKTICERFYNNMDETLASVSVNRLMNGNYAPNSMIIFKSYVNEAVEIVPDNVSFVLNKSQPFKSTVSMVNDDYFLVRYSFNVHMKSTSPMWLYRENDRVANLQYFPLDVYFLDLSIKRSPQPLVNAYTLGKIYGVDVYVESLKYLIADQLECILFNVFNYCWSKVDSRIERLYNLIVAQTDYFRPSDDEIQRFAQIVKTSRQRFTVRDVKSILYALGPLGPRAIIELYFTNRFDNHVKYVTHQINFPYHRWESDYFSKCWKQFLYIINIMYGLEYKIEI